MGQVTLNVGGRRYDLACRDGEETHLQALAALVDGKAAQAARAVGSSNEARQLLMAALLLADEMGEMRAGAGAAPSASLGRTVERLAERMEVLAERLEKADPSS